MTKLQNELQKAGINFNVEGCYLIIGGTWVVYSEYDHIYRAYGDGGILSGEFQSESSVLAFIKSKIQNGSAIGYFTTPAPEKYEYTATNLDAQKKQADALLTSIDGNYYTLFLNRDLGIEPGRGVRVNSEKSISVTEKIYNQLKEQFNILCDF